MGKGRATGGLQAAPASISRCGRAGAEAAWRGERGQGGLCREGSEGALDLSVMFSFFTRMMYCSTR